MSHTGQKTLSHVTVNLQHDPRGNPGREHATGDAGALAPCHPGTGTVACTAAARSAVARDGGRFNGFH